MTNYSAATLSVQQLRQALAIREQIERLEQDLAAIAGGPARGRAKRVGRPRTRVSPAELPAPAVRRRRRGYISAAGRARIAAAQRARWAKLRAGKAAPARRRRRRGQLSAEGRARIVAAQKARWAKVRATKGRRAG